MGLRIGQGSSGVLGTLRSLQQSLLDLRQSQERLATGRAINRASDNPAGLVISELLRTKIGSLEQAVENTQQATNFVNTAEGALQEVTDQLVDLRRNAIAALNTGGFDDQAIQALQDQADRSIDAIGRIAASTRFGRESLLNGSQGFVTSGVPAQIANVAIQQVDLSGGPRQVDIVLSQAATQASAAGTIAGAQPGAVVRISGELGSRTISVAGGASVAQVEAAINSERDFTGVFASGGQIFSTDVGSDAFVQIEELSGDLAGIAEGRTEGTDAVGTIEGQAATGDGNTLSLSDASLRAAVTFAPGTAPGTFSFDIVSGGATFQLGGEPNASDRLQIGIDSIDPGRLGQSSGIGSLDSIDLVNNPSGAVQVVDAALTELAALRSNLGSLVQSVFEPNSRSLGVSIENLTASESQVRDTDYALEVARAVRNQILTQAGVRILGLQNIQGKGILSLLQS